MEQMTDVYSKVGKYLMDEDFYSCTVGEQKELVQEALKDYVVRRISKLDLMRGLDVEKSKDKLSLNELVEILGTMIPEIDHFNTIRHLIHCILNIAGTMQNFSITWWEEDDKDLIENPQIEFNSEGNWDSILTNKDTSYIQTFKFVNQTFMDEYKDRKKDHKSLVLTPKKKEIPASNK